MNNKILLAIIALAVIGIAGFFLFSRNVSQKPESTMQVSPKKAEKQMAENTVEVTSSSFTPQSITVKAGTKVTWVNKSGDVANVSSDYHPTHLLYPPLNLGNFDNGSSVFLVFDKKGKYTYHNHLNPSATGVVVVE